MNLFNATLLRIDTPQPAGPAGDVVYTNGPAIAVRCLQDEPTYATKYVLGIVIAEATAVIFVPTSSGVAFKSDDHVTVTIDGGVSLLYQVVYRRDRILTGGLSHFEVYLKGL